ncbi:hypothetical protein HAX54_014878, partial [Datura stramonium]|nr:hypothetical protein [Datura stramonium]
THYSLASGLVDPLMSSYSGEGAARYFRKEDAKKRIHGGGKIIGDVRMVNRPHLYHYRDDGSEKEFELNYSMCICCNYIPLKNADVFY